MKRSDPAIRVVLMPRDTNEMGTIFGGIILSYIDQAGVIEARKHNPSDRFVTVAMKEIIFKEPVYVGDIVSFYAETIKIGDSSIKVQITVEAERRKSPGLKVIVTHAEAVYVCIDQSGKPISIKR
ncbi:MAG: acyl-CoA thioesterase [Planctomycetes bacterium]|nr:acyl-CoA thioesterase [Planctomycetota bacterium]